MTCFFSSVGVFVRVWCATFDVLSDIYNGTGMSTIRQHINNCAKINQRAARHLANLWHQNITFLHDGQSANQTYSQTVLETPEWVCVFTECLKWICSLIYYRLSRVQFELHYSNFHLFSFSFCEVSKFNFDIILSVLFGCDGLVMAKGRQQ